MRRGLAMMIDAGDISLIIAIITIIMGVIALVVGIIVYDVYACLDLAYSIHSPDCKPKLAEFYEYMGKVTVVLIIMLVVSGGIILADIVKDVLER